MREPTARRVAAVLLHHPVLDRQGTVVTTAITNLDLHDIARSAYSYGLTDYYVAHPIRAQRELALRVREHWVHGAGGQRIPDRVAPLNNLRVVESLDAVLKAMGSHELWLTSAQSSENSLSFTVARARLSQPGPPVLLCFGTGWGLAPTLQSAASARLEPIRSPRTDGYNHLSVRAAAAVVFDRLLG